MILKKTIYNDDKNYAPKEGEQIFGPRENRSTAESPIVQAQMAMEDAAKASKRASEAVKAAGEAAEIANAIDQKVWEDDAGLHISSGRKDAEAEKNSIWNSLGMLFRKGLYPILGILTGNNPRVAIYDGQGSSEDHEVASFGINGTKIGRRNVANAYRAEVGASGLKLIRRNEDNTADIQYATFGTTAIIGDINSFCVEISDEAFGFFADAATPLGSIASSPDGVLHLTANGDGFVINNVYGEAPFAVDFQNEYIYLDSPVYSLYVKNKNAKVGQVFSWNGSLKSNLTANAGAYVEAAGSITLPAGHTYLVIGYLAMTNSTNGTTNRRIQFFNKTNATALITESRFVATQDWGTLQIQQILETSVDTTLTVRGASSRPTTTIPTAWIRAVCIA